MARHEAFAVQAPVAILRTLGLARANPPFFAIRPCLPPSLPPCPPASPAQAVLEETDIRIAELRKDAYEFKRDIVVRVTVP